MAPRPPRRRLSDARAYARVGAMAAAALAALQLVRLAVRSPQAVATARSGATAAAPAALVQRLVVPDLYAALEGVLREGSGAGAERADTVAVLDCGDGRWADVWPTGGGVAVDSVVCFEFSGTPDEGDGPTADAAAAAAVKALATVPWLHHGSVTHVQHSPHGGAAVSGGKGGGGAGAGAASGSRTKLSADAATSTGGRKAAGGGPPRPIPSTPSTTPRTILALAADDGKNVPARYLPFIASAMAVGGARLVLVDGGNTPAPGDGDDEAAAAHRPPPKKPRTPGFQVLEAGGTTAAAAAASSSSHRRSPSPRHRFYQLALNTVQPTFARVYETKLWSAAGGGSGTGSTLPATESLRTDLLSIIAKYKVKSFLDSSCGSMHWMPLVARAAHAADAEFKFTGTDAVCSLVESHHSTFANESAWMDFACVDASHEPLPAGYDLVFSRDSLQHLPIASAYKFLHNVRASGAKYLLVGSYLTGGQRVTGGRNADVDVGEMYDVDLLQPPFNVRPPPLEVIKENNPEQKFMLLLDVGRLSWDEDLALT